MKRIIRFSDRASLQLVHIKLRFSSIVNTRYRVGVDVASGDFENSYLFRVQHYMAVDLERPRVELPESFDSASFAEVDISREAIPSGDLVICMETLGLNEKFDHSESFTVVEKLIDATNEGGASFQHRAAHEQRAT